MASRKNYLFNDDAAKELQKQINARISKAQKAMEEVVKNETSRVYLKIIDYIRENYYNTYGPYDSYDRLGDDGGFLGAIAMRFSTQNGIYYGEVYFDPNKLTYDREGYWGRHINYETGNRLTDELFDYFMYGVQPYGCANSSHPMTAVTEGFSGLGDKNGYEARSTYNYYSFAMWGQIKEVIEYANEYLYKYIMSAAKQYGFIAK